MGNLGVALLDLFPKARSKSASQQPANGIAIRPDAVIINRHLVRADSQRFEKLVYVGAVAGTVPRAIPAKSDAFAHKGDPLPDAAERLYRTRYQRSGEPATGRKVVSCSFNDPLWGIVNAVP